MTMKNIYNWLWRKWLYRVSWWLGERKFAKWVRYGKNKGAFLKFDSWEQLHQWENDMLKQYEDPKRASILNVFKPYDQWGK